MNMPLVLEFLAELEQNNNREWYHENKAKYQTANLEFEMLVHELLLDLHKSDKSIPITKPGELTFKLMRDTRFSHDKSPYNPSFRAHMGPKGKLPVPVGYFLLVQPGGRSFLGGGLFADMFKDATAMVRDYMEAHGTQWESIIRAPEFVSHFTVGGTALKKVPQGYDPCHPQAEYLKNKSWYLEYSLTDKQLGDADFIEFAGGIFKEMQDFNGFLNKALAEFQMPQR